jgi:ribonuclease T1
MGWALACSMLPTLMVFRVLLLLSFGLCACLAEAPATSPLPTLAAVPVVQAPPHASAHSPLLLDNVPTSERGAVVDVVARIDAGGPFAYSKDGSVFQNRERRLPTQPAGFWREYTVETPGSSDRGARRIVGGDDDSLHYTRDHYDSFVLLRAARGAP